MQDPVVHCDTSNEGEVEGSVIVSHDLHQYICSVQYLTRTISKVPLSYLFYYMNQILLTLFLFLMHQAYRLLDQVAEFQSTGFANSVYRV